MTNHESQGSHGGMNIAGKQETQGYILVVMGILLFLYALNFLPNSLENLFNWIFAAGGILLTLFGAHKALLWTKIQEQIKRFKK